MKTKQAILLCALSLLAVGCEQEETTVWDDPSFVRVNVSTEPMHLENRSMSVRLSDQDTVMLFDRSNKGVKIYTTDNSDTTAVYYTHKWTGGTPTYASWPASDEYSACRSGGVLGVYLPPVQTLKAANNFAAGSVVAVGMVTGNSTAYKIPLRNISGLVRVGFGDASARSIKIESAGGEAMAGCVDVDYAKLVNGDASFWTPADGHGSSQSVTIVADADSAASDEEGCLTPGVYYVSMLPQTYSQGFVVTVTYADGTTLERRIHSDGIDIPRCELTGDNELLDDTLPDIIEIDLQFYNENDECPFEGIPTDAATARNTESVSGEEYVYAYKYMCDGNQLTKNLTFTICRGANATSDYYAFTKAGSLQHPILFSGSAASAWIKLPGIPGRYLKYVSLDHGNNTAAKRFRLQEGVSPVGKYFSSTLLTAKSETEPVKVHVNIPTGTTTTGQLDDTEMGRSYVMQFTTGTSLRIFNIHLTFTKDDPATITE